MLLKMKARLKTKLDLTKMFLTYSFVSFLLTYMYELLLVLEYDFLTVKYAWFSNLHADSW